MAKLADAHDAQSSKNRKRQIGLMLCAKQMSSAAKEIPPEELRRLACREDDARVVQRLLALAIALDGVPRGVAAKPAAMDTQAPRDWVIRYNRGGLADAWAMGGRAT